MLPDANVSVDEPYSITNKLKSKKMDKWRYQDYSDNPEHDIRKKIIWLEKEFENKK